MMSMDISKRNLLYFVFACLLFLALQSGLVLATDPEPEPLKPERERPITMDRRLPENLRDKESAPSVETDYGTIAPWETVAYQSYRDGNWEVYTSNFDNDNHRVTNEISSDVYPSLSRDCNLIVFSSYRHGTSEIYVKNIGTFKRLTNNDANDTLPAFSPDESRIVFQSYRDGNAEIYTMNADGTDQKRLTYHGGYDGDAAWSPDGQTIAFSSNRSGGYRIWVMDVDGGNLRQLSGQHFSEYPAWSPDGTKIAYDADGDGNSWQELWVMNADGSGQTRLAYPGSLADFLVGSWSPDGDYISFTSLQWVEYSGEWYWDSMNLFKWSLAGHNYTYIDVGSSRYDGFPDWQSCDLAPPVTSVNRLPQYSKERVLVEWYGYDSGASGIKDYDIQYRIGTTGDWMDWMMATTARSAYFEPLFGGTIYFRGRARDNAGHVEPWPEGDGDANVTFFSWLIEGSSYDNRGTPLSGVVISDTAVIGTPASDAQGFYRALFAGYDFQFEPSWSKENFLELPETAFSRTSDRYLDVFMPPADNSINDWGFESGIFSPSGWQVGGEVDPSITSTVRHTGDKAAFLGVSPEIGEPTQVVTGANIIFDRKKMSLVRENIHLLWQSGPSQSEELNYATSSGDSQWSVHPLVNGTPGNIDRYFFDVGTDGRAHLLWDVNGVTRDTMYYAFLDPGGSWTDPEIVYGAGRTDIIDVAADDDGSLHIIWSLSGTNINGTYYSVSDSSGNWASPVPIESDWYQTQILVVDETGKPHIIANRYSNLYHRYQDSNGNWVGPIQIAHNYEFNTLMATFDDQNVLHLSWINHEANPDILHMMLPPDGSWTSPEYIVYDGGVVPDSLQITALDGGDLLAIWLTHVENQCDHPFYAGYEAQAGEWTDPFLIDTGGICTSYLKLQRSGNRAFYAATYQTVSSQQYCTGELDLSGGDRLAHCIERQAGSNSGIAMIWDAENRFHLVWKEYAGSGIYGIYDAATSLASTGDSSAIYQEIIVPTEETHPTLSMLYVQGGANGSAGQGFEVNLETDLGTVGIYSDTNSSGGWVHRWFDVSSWAGETVTLTLASNQVVGTPVTWLYLDEVTMGSTYPDPWLVISGQDLAMPGKSLQVSIEYGNLGHVSAESTQITMSIPAVFSYTSASVTPSATEPNLVWDVGDLPAESGPTSIVVTFTVTSEFTEINAVDLESALTCGSADLDMNNNSVIWHILLLKYVYLPAILK